MRSMLPALLAVSASLPTLAQERQPSPGQDAGPRVPGGPRPCRDRDGDGLCDAWERAQQLPNGTPLPGADPDRPDIYVQYDYMGWAAPGAACLMDDDCKEGGLQPNLVCHDSRCNHDHRPDPLALQMVTASFARHGVALHVSSPREVPHSEVITFARAGEPGNGWRAICAGADLQAGGLGGYAVSFFDVKDAFFDPLARPSHHYVVFGHFNTCTTDDPGAPAGNCNQCPPDRSTPAGQPHAGTSGISEVPGNDFIVSLASSFYNPVASVPRSPYVEAAVFMHELGHNLGLHHAGDVPAPEDAPNYLSVMNGRYVLSGILQSEGVGSNVPKACSTDADCAGGAVCRPIPAGGGRCTRIDYSSSTLSTLDEGALDEQAGASPPSSGLQDILLYADANGLTRRGAAAGPVDWDGDGVLDTQPVAVDLNLIAGPTEVMRGYDDWDHGACVISSDCPINAIRQAIHDLIDPTVDPHEACIRNRCQPQWRAFQRTPWGRRD